MSAPLRLLGQAGGTPVVLDKGHTFRGRVTGPCLPGSGQLLRAAILGLGLTPSGFPADLRVFESVGELPADWPADRRGTASGCPLWWEARASRDVPVDLSQLTSLPGFGVLDVWDSTTGAILFGSTMPAIPGAPPMTVPPFTKPTTPLPVPSQKQPPITGGSPASSTSQPANLFWLAAGATLLSIVFKVFK